jgi:hypothetical protein
MVLKTYLPPSLKHFCKALPKAKVDFEIFLGVADFREGIKTIW